MSETHPSERVRNNLIGGGLDYDGYESEGASTNSDPSINYAEIKLKINFTLLANCNIKACVKSHGIDNTENSTDQIVQWIIGGETDEQQEIREKFDWGTYDLIWEGIDAQGNSRTRDQKDAEGIVTNLDGIYARNGRYYVWFDIISDFEQDHSVKGADYTYETRNLPNNLNPANTTHGQQIDTNPGSVRKAQFWKLTLGATTPISPVFNSSFENTGVDLHQSPRKNRPSGDFNLTFFAAFSDRNKPGVKTYLQGGGAAYNKNREVKHEIRIEEGSCIVFPREEIYRSFLGTISYADGTNHFTLHSSTPDTGHHKRLPGIVISSDTGITITNPTGGNGYHTNDEFYTAFYPVLTKNYDHGEIPGVPGLDRSDNFDKLNELETAVTFNPLQYGMRFDEIPKNIFTGIDGTSGVKNIIKGDRSLDPSQQNPTWITTGFKRAQVVYITRWFNIYYNVWDRSGRPATTFAWSHENGFGSIADPSHPRKGWIGIRFWWIPVGGNDSRGGNPSVFGAGLNWNWINALDNNNVSVKRIIIPGYSGLKDSEVPTGSNIETHLMFFMHSADPTHQANLQNLEITTANWRNNWGKYGAFMWPIWYFHRINTGANNYSLRAVFPEGNVNYLGDPPVEGFRG
jgi:hypothetical protein